MDKTLDRVLSLIPRKPDGKFVHGALKEFTKPLGFKDGHIVSDWIAGNSESYKNYLYEISMLHNVSVEWLKGETDDRSVKKKPVQSLDELLPGYSDLDDDRKAKVREYIALLYKDQCSE